MSPPRLGVFLDHVSPRSAKRLCQNRTHGREAGQLEGGARAVDGAVVSGQGGRGEDLQTGQKRVELGPGAHPLEAPPTFFSWAGLWARVKPSRIFPLYSLSLHLPAGRTERGQRSLAPFQAPARPDV